jgi:hypothetical protein
VHPPVLLICLFGYVLNEQYSVYNCISLNSSKKKNLTELLFNCIIKEEGISIWSCYKLRWYELRHDKTNIMGLRTAWIQTSLRLRAVGSGSMLFAISFSTFYRVCKRTAWILIWGWSGPMLVANPLCWFCHDAAHIMILLLVLMFLCVSLFLFLQGCFLCFSYKCYGQTWNICYQQSKCSYGVVQVI